MQKNRPWRLLQSWIATAYRYLYQYLGVQTCQEAMVQALRVAEAQEQAEVRDVAEAEAEAAAAVVAAAWAALPPGRGAIAFALRADRGSPTSVACPAIRKSARNVMSC